jgi:hypothetical protein
MGNGSSASEYTPQPELVREVETENVYALLDARQNATVLDVDAGGDTFNHFMTKYRLELIPKIPTDCYLILVFPFHAQERKRVLYTNKFSTTHSLNKEINARLRASTNTQNYKLAIVCGHQVYRLRNFTGNIYLYWANAKQITQANIVNEPFKGVPVIIEMDGRGRIESWCMLRSKITERTDLDLLPVQSLTLCMPREPFFPCELDPRTPVTPQLQTLSQTQVHNMLVQNVEATSSALLNHATGYTMVDEVPVIGEISLESLQVRPSDIVRTEHPEQPDERDPFESDSSSE